MNIVFFDIDGTLALGRDVPESAAEAIAALRARGDKAFICSGRFRAYAEKYFSRYADGFICCNGRLAFEGEKTILSEPLSEAQVKDIMERTDAADAGCVFYEATVAHYYGADAYINDKVNLIEGGVDRNIDPKTMRAYNFDLFYGDTANYEKVAAAFADGYILNPHHPYPNADVTIQGADKGTTIAKVLDFYGIDRDNAYAFGDGMNDITMLRAVGHGIAMGNAKDEVKAVAEYVTAHISEDGVAKGLHRFGLA